MAKIVTITNPLTGQPAQVDQLDHTAQEIDDAIARALPGGYYDKWVSQLPGHNLLDNSVFVDGCLVDQRQGRLIKPNTTYYSDNQLTTSAGTTSAYVKAYRYATGTASGVNYASFKLTDTDDAPTYYAAPENVARGYYSSGHRIDRWTSLVGSNVFTIEDGFISVQSLATARRGITQYVENFRNFAGKTVTLSALCRADVGSFQLAMSVDIASITHASDVYSDTDFTLRKWTFDVPETITSRLAFGLYTVGNNSKFSAKAIKLELGTTQTLAHQDENGNWVLNEIPDYGEQLAKCQRYFQLYSSADIRPAKAVDCRPTMRADPAQGTVVVNGTTYYYNNADL